MFYQIDELRQAFSDWEIDFDLYDDFWWAVDAAREPKTFLVHYVDNLTYKKEMMSLFKKEYEIQIDFSDQELLENRFLSGENQNMKITKYLTKIAKEKRGEYHCNQNIDVFNTYYDGKIIISNNPILLMELYNKIQTCHSPRGSECGNMLKLLLSKYVFIATDEKKTFRALILIDGNRKTFYIGRIYGGYNSIVPISIGKYFAKLGYSHIERCHFYFDLNHFDYDDFINAHYSEFDVIRNIQKHYDLHINPIPQSDFFRTNYDVIDRSKFGNPTHYSLCKVYTQDGCISLDSGYFCGDCGRNVSEDDYYGNGQCNDCFYEKHSYCHKCGEDVENENYIYELDMCRWCASDRGYRYCESCEDWVTSDKYYVEECLCDDCYEAENQEDNDNEENE